MYRNALQFRVLVTRLRLKYSPALNFTLDPFDSDRSGHVTILFCHVYLGILANLVRGSAALPYFPQILCYLPCRSLALDQLLIAHVIATCGRPKPARNERSDEAATDLRSYGLRCPPDGWGESSPTSQESGQPKNSPIAWTTLCCSSSRISGNMGRARTSRAARSASGKLPSL